MIPWIASNKSSYQKYSESLELGKIQNRAKCGPVKVHDLETNAFMTKKKSRFFLTLICIIQNGNKETEITYHHQNRQCHGGREQQLGDVVQLEVNQADLGAWGGIVHGSPALGARVDDDADGRARGHHGVGPHGVLDAQGLFLQNIT